jgi:hypothetical protein
MASIQSIELIIRRSEDLAEQRPGGANSILP